MIKGHFRSAKACCFKRIAISEIIEQLDNLTTKRASPIDSNPTKAIKEEAISFLGQNVWRDLALHIKKYQSVKHLKKHIEVSNFICKFILCKTFVVSLGYV